MGLVFMFLFLSLFQYANKRNESMHLAHELQTKVSHIAQLHADEEMKEANKYDSYSDGDESDCDSDYCEGEEDWGMGWSGIALKTGSAGKTSPHSMAYYMA